MDSEDPQVYELDPDVTIRAIGKWSTNGDEAADYNFAQIGRYHANGVTFMGSGTASVIPQDFATAEIFDDMSTRDADDVPVPHDEFGFAVPARRGNLFNPARAVRVGAGNVAASLLVGRGTGRRTIHLVNHNYDRAITPQTGFTVSVDLPSCPRRVSMVSPDAPGTIALPSSCRHGRLTVAVHRLDYYDVLVLD